MARSLPIFCLASPVILGCAGALCLVAGAVHLPRLGALALSHDGQFSGSTEWELIMMRAGLLSVGVVLSLVALFFTKMEKSEGGWVQGVRKDIEAWRVRDVPPRADSWNQVWTAVTVLYLASMLAVLWWSQEMTHETVPDTFRLITEESGVYETLTAVVLVLAAAFLWRTGGLIHWSEKRSPRIFAAVPYGLGLLFLVAAGEELSWGQHYVGFLTPEAMMEVNVQKEFNLHNVGGYWANNALLVFFFVFAGVLPIAYRLFWDVAYVCDRLNIPVATLWLAPVALLSMMFDEREPFVSLFGHPVWRLSEIREALFGIVMLAVCGEFWLRYGRRPVRVVTADSQVPAH